MAVLCNGFGRPGGQHIFQKQKLLIKMVDSRARQILDKIGPLPESALLATLCIVLADEIQGRPAPVATEADLREILARIREIKHKISQ